MRSPPVRRRCCVRLDVGVAPAGSAGFALEDRLALAVPGITCPHVEHRATYTRPGSARPGLRPVLQTRGEKPPTLRARRVHPALLRRAHRAARCSARERVIGRTQGFDPDRVEAARNVSGDFFDPVLAPVGLTGFQFRDRPFRSRAPVGATLGPGEPLLQHRQPLGLTLGQTGCVQQFAGRQRRRHGNTTVDAHHAPIARPRRSGRGCGRTRYASGRPDHG